MLLRQHPQQVSSAPDCPTVVSSSNAPRIAPIRRPIDKSPLGNPTGKKILPVTAVKTVATPPSGISKQGNVPGSQLLFLVFRAHIFQTAKWSWHKEKKAFNEIEHN
uniref:Uncharacterized protein n=1 Tax=Oryza rufipogon TaxID=4529 RepID=A0A0E0Q7C3_ORYRU